MFLKNLMLLGVCCGVFCLPLNVDADSQQADTKKPATEKSSPVQLSFFAPLQILPENYNIYGLKLGLPYSCNKSLNGLDIGFCNEITEDLYGVSLAAFLSLHGDNMYGVNFAGIFNISSGNESGLSFAGFYNEVGSSVYGIQTSMLYNQAKEVKGVQFGLVNYCNELSGVQIGVINVCKTQPFPFTLFFNFYTQKH